MNYGLEAADVWLNSLSSMWKRVAFFWCFVAGIGWLSAWWFGRDDMGGAMAGVLQVGGLTYVLLGPVCVWAWVVAAVTWVRFVHLETAGIRAFLLLGTLVAINGWLEGDMNNLERWKFGLLQVAILIMTMLAVWWPGDRVNREL